MATSNTTTPSSIKMRELYARVVKTMEEQKPFLLSGLNLEKLARLVGTNRTFLSTTINCMTGVNFTHWLSAYRVQYLIDSFEHHPDKTLDELSRDAGFPSRTSFFRQFREVKGISPKQYMEQQSRKEPDPAPDFGARSSLS